MQEFNITLVQSMVEGRPYCKIDGKYTGRTWKNTIGLQRIPYNIEAVYEACKILNEKPDVCMVYGTAKKKKIINTDRTMMNFIEEPTYLLTLDLDKYKGGLKDEYPSHAETIKEADKFIFTYLPPEFQDVSYILRFSSSFLSRDTNFRAHIIFLLESSQYPREIGTWIKRENIPTDPTFYLNLTQPIFTAGPQFKDKLDPLTKVDGPLPRVSLIRRNKDIVPEGWQPYKVEKKKPLNLDTIPEAANLPGKVGSFCRKVSIEKALTELGYEQQDDTRFLSPTSQTGLAGVKVFPNGYCFSHHSDDPIAQIADKVFKGKRSSFNSYDLMNSWAMLNPELLNDFHFIMNEAILSDQFYQDEIINEFIFRTEWLIEDGYTGDNKLIVDTLLFDISKVILTEMSREYIFDMIVAKTNNKIKKAVLKNAWKMMRKDAAQYRNEYSPEAGIRHMANIFLKKKIVYSHHGGLRGDFWCYYSNKRMWKRLNRDQTDGFIYRHLHAALPIKIEIPLRSVEDLTKVILRSTCEAYGIFKRGKGWAFKGGKVGILMDSLFKQKWRVKDNIKTLKREYHIHRELPITYEQWKRQNGLPPIFNDFLASSCDEDYLKMELIQEYMGYILADSYYLHNFMVLEGVPGSGKSILLKIIRNCIGSRHYAAISLNRIGGTFGIGELPDKMLAVMSEAREIDFNQLRAAIPIILKMTGGDPIDIEAKHKMAVTEILDSKLLIVTNRTPVMPDDTGALTQRMIMVKFNRTFRGTKEEILGLDETISEKEVPAIIKWALKGLEQLSDRKQFNIPKSVLKESSYYREQLDPLRTFISEYFRFDHADNKEKWVISSQFTGYFQEYLFRIGQQLKRSVVQKRATIRSLKALDNRLDKVQVRNGNSTVSAISPLIANTNLDIEFASERTEIIELGVDN